MLVPFREGQVAIAKSSASAAVTHSIIVYSADDVRGISFLHLVHSASLPSLGRCFFAIIVLFGDRGGQLKAEEANTAKKEKRIEFRL